MALMVEAAELAEIFQWMTPEQSQASRGDLVLQEQVADEVADVLLYLVQIADYTGIDLKRAVGRKLVKNSKKHPPLRPGLPGFRVGNRHAVGVHPRVNIGPARWVKIRSARTI
jgi:NTP pyrophosphatase (non-canonical NTP hydrolase)